LLAIALTLAVAVFIVSALAFMLAGPVVTAWLAKQLGFGYLFVVTWEILRWPLMVIFAVLGIDLLYYFAPNTSMRWDWLTPGAALATALWIGSSLGFRFYIGHLRNFNAAYGAIAGVIIVLIWFYLSALALVVGAELNGVLQKGRTPPPGP
jgi:membrane protein